MASQLSETVHVKTPRRREVRRGLCACRKPLSNSQDASTNLTRPAWFQLSGDGPTSYSPGLAGHLGGGSTPVNCDPGRCRAEDRLRMRAGLRRPERVSPRASALMAQGALTAAGAGEEVVPASELRSAHQQIRELQRLLGKKTLENEILREAVERVTAPKKLPLRVTSWPGDGR